MQRPCQYRVVRRILQRIWMLKSKMKLYHQILSDIVLNEQALRTRLEYLRTIDEQAYFAAGIVRNTVWSVLHQQQPDIEHTEIDVIYFDRSAQHAVRQKNLERQLREVFPKQHWDVVNQAQVHTWYKTEGQQNISPLAFN